ncbi:hypothetical protein DSCW_60980 [Desulfosarcina widdelii]|uniref:Uncharacterized protein n=1 Tax=Desulfosarcina widdelii TaxID=947919 RepID=A0A5K7ZFW2_9BACT|nr:hypothetical protein DSCW_60980 [Desulfosarcina widdelii]
MLGYKLTYMAKPALSIEFTAPFPCVSFRLCEYAQNIVGNQGKNNFFSPSVEKKLPARLSVERKPNPGSGGPRFPVKG